ncbi:MAG TPA: DegT/DnrJ/EryC1/StrS aminotransferase family protein [Candidatus Paceibacterota bacterium]|nr:DegT/DnrJ/EryC1/StrS aminotransferase family protein [Candidatus Paceibacterota bacterium]HMO82748.1 DegT/DnrJ/EryC1/StrS aminotransferase family protein [Candidatus Paceibacterota bacterium]
MKFAFIEEATTKRALAEFIINAEKLSMGEQCLSFEKAFAEKQRTKHASLFNSGGSANLALLQALKNLGRLKNGDRIGFSALTWSTNVMPIIQLNMVPVPIDCEIETLNSSRQTLQVRIEETHLDAFFITNALGFTDDLAGIKDICEERNIILIEDNCESLGTELVEGRTGNFGVASTFSFFVAHHMSTIEGGMICTNDTELSDMITIVRANGWDRNLSCNKQEQLRKKYNVESEFQSKYTFYDLAYNLRPTEITGFLGLTQLEYLDANIDKRYQNYIEVEAALKENRDFIVPNKSHIKKLSTFAIPFICKTSDKKDFYVRRFIEAGVEVRPMIAGNITKQPFYTKYVKESYKLPKTDYLHANAFYCGNYPELTSEDINLIKSLLAS